MIIEESMHKNATPKGRRSSLARKILAVTLSMALMLSTIGMSAFAGETEGTENTDTTVVQNDSQVAEAFDIGILASSDLIISSDQFGSNMIFAWDDVIGATKYTVERAFFYGGTQGEYTPLSSQTTTGYTDYYLRFPAGAHPSEVLYRFTAYEQFNDVLDQVKVKINCEYPAANMTLVATPNGFDAVDLSWDDPLNEPNVNITYTIYTSSTENGVYTPIATTYDVLSYTDGGKVPDTDYYYRVIATDTDSDSFYGESDPVLVRLDYPIPSSMSAVSQGIDSIKVNWDAISGVGEYVVYRSDAANGTYVEVDRVTSPEFIDTGLNDNTAYFYKVAVSIPAGVGPQSDYATATTDIAIPGKPINVTAVALSSSSVQVDWDTVAAASGYYVYRSASANGTYSLVGTVATNSFVNTGLMASTGYYYKVAAYNVHGTGELSDYAYVMTPGPPPKCAPGCLCAKALSSSSIKVTWGKVKDASGYYVYRSLSKDGPYVFVGSTTERLYIDEGLASSTKYYYKVSAYNAGGEGPLSKCAACAKTRLASPNAPQMIGASALGSSSIQINWNAVNGATRYYVYRASSENGNYINIGRTSSTSFVNTGLAPNTTYYYKVTAYNSMGQSAFSDFGSATTSLATPAAPKSLRAKALNSSSMSLSWAPAQYADGYYVYRATSSKGVYDYIGTTVGTSFTDTGLMARTTYYYKVAAYSAGGTGPLSSYDSEKTLR